MEQRRTTIINLLDMMSLMASIGDFVDGSIYAPRYLHSHLMRISQPEKTLSSISGIDDLRESVNAVQEYWAQHDLGGGDPRTPYLQSFVGDIVRRIEPLKVMPSSELATITADSSQRFASLESFDYLLLIGLSIDRRAYRFQSASGSLLAENAQRRVKSAYENWFAKALSILPEERVKEFRAAYDGSFWAPKIKAFLSAPLASNVLYSEATKDNPFVSSPWQHPYEHCFKTPFDDQMLVLKEVKERGHGRPETQRPTGVSRVFVGHGRSSLYLEVRDFLRHELKLDVDYFEGEERSGYFNHEIITQMLEAASFAVIVLTADDEVEDGFRARQNVVHEVGLFQGRLGFRRVALLRQSEVAEWSNLHGLQELRFIGQDIKDKFYGLSKMLEREGLVPER